MNETASLPSVPTCSICHGAAPLETAKTDERGQIVHEECYVFKMKLIEASSKPKK